MLTIRPLPQETRYTRQDVLRILHLETRDLLAWEREGLIPVIEGGQMYSFEHLSCLRTLREFRLQRISARSIRVQVDAMQRVAGMGDALRETSAERRGSRLAFRYAGALVDPSTQQLAFDFATLCGRKLEVSQPCGRWSDGERVAAQVQEMFVRGVQLEENAGTMEQAMQIYRAILEVKPNHAPTCINLGTILYNKRDFRSAEQMYRRATEADANYALAFFDLGNVLDELQQLGEAIEAYLKAVALVPQYADAHYNLALAYERQEERRKALRHWMAYIRLDPSSPWSIHAKAQAKKILALEKLTIVSRRGCGAAG